MTLSRAARLLLDLPRGYCRWFSRHDLNDERFTWCGEPAQPGKPYCARHQRRAYDTGEDTGAPDDVVAADGATYRVVVTTGNEVGSRRRFRVVPNDATRRATRSPDGVVDVRCGMGSAERRTRATAHENGSSGDARAMVVP
jgi:hypothetical protein